MSVSRKLLTVQNVFSIGTTILRRAVSTGRSLMDDYIPIELKDDELNETFIKGGGPGGQKVNKTSSCVQLTHIPTGIVVKCQTHRSQERNRKAARKILVDKLDLLYNKEKSKFGKEREHERKLDANYKRKRKEREEMKESALLERQRMRALMEKVKGENDPSL